MMMLMLVLVVVGAMAESQDSGERRTLCGRELAHAHLLYCHGLEPVPEESDETTFKTPVFGKAEIASPKIPDRFTHKFRRAANKELDSSLINACCVKPCHIYELLKNC